jgi:predicted dienelactone hydrolase
MPSLFGREGAVPQVEEGRAIFRQACVSAEFRAFAANESSPVTTWLRALARLAHRECGGPGVARRPLRRTRPARQRRQPRHPAVLRTRGVLMAPNAAPFTDDALAKVTVPVLVYAAEKDDLTRDPDGFDRDALHEVMNREIVGFFDHTLPPAGGTLAKSPQPASCRSRESTGG